MLNRHAEGLPAAPQCHLLTAEHHHRTVELMRLWGYVNEEGHPRKGTLDVLAQYLGYRD